MVTCFTPEKLMSKLAKSNKNKLKGKKRRSLQLIKGYVIKHLIFGSPSIHLCGCFQSCFFSSAFSFFLSLPLMVELTCVVDINSLRRLCRAYKQIVKRWFRRKKPLPSREENNNNPERQNQIQQVQFNYKHAHIYTEKCS